MTNKQFLKKNKWVGHYWEEYKRAREIFDKKVRRTERHLKRDAVKEGFNDAFFVYAEEGVFGIQVGGKYGDSKSGKLIHDSELDKEAK